MVEFYQGYLYARTAGQLKKGARLSYTILVTDSLVRNAYKKKSTRNASHIERDFEQSQFVTVGR